MCDCKYKLTYFNGRGRAEIVRLIFAVAGQKYNDVRIERDAWPGDLKDKTPFGQIPILEVEGVTLCQSNAIALYLANEFGLAGKTALDKARAHMVIECTEDVLKPFLGFMFEKDETRKAELKKKYVEETLPKNLAGLEKILKQNNGGNGFFVGDGLTWADLGVLNLADWLKVIGSEGQLANYEKLHALLARVAAVPSIAEWLAKRPVTQF